MKYVTNRAKICPRFVFVSPQEYLETCMNKLENLYEQHRRLCYSVNITAQTTTATCTTSASNATGTTTSCNASSNASNCSNNVSNSSTNSTTNSSSSMLDPMTPTQQPNIEITNKSQSGTPTDVQDVSF